MWSPRRSHAERFASGAEMPVEVADSARAAVQGADLICTTTSSPDPILAGEWLGPGAHVNAVGSSISTALMHPAARFSKKRASFPSSDSAWNTSPWQGM